MIESIFDFCLLHIIQMKSVEFINQLNFINYFEVIDIQTDDTLILADDDFAELKERKLTRVALTFKKRKKSISIISIKFNDKLIILVNDDNILLFTQSKQFDQIKLINFVVLN